MGIPVMSLLAFAAPPAKAAPNGAPHAHENARNHNGFAGLLASLSAPAVPDKGARPRAEEVESGPTVKEQLEQVLSALSGGEADLDAPGLGLTSAQQRELASKLEKLVKSSDNGAELLAELLAATQLKAVQVDDLSKLVKLLSTGADGFVSLDALTSNLHLLTRAIHLMASSAGKMTLLEAVQELTGKDDAFAQQLAAAMAQTDDSVSDDPIPIDTGPPEGGTGAEAAGEAASASAGSNGRESTVTPTRATSPADGAAEEAAAAAGTEPDTETLAKLLEDWLRDERSSKEKPSQPTAAAAVRLQERAQPGAQAAAQAAAPAPAVSQPDAAAQLAQMAPVQSPAAAKAASPQAPSAGIVSAAGQNGALGETHEGADAGAGEAATATPVAVVTPAMQQSGGHEQAATQHDGQQPSQTSASAGQSAGAAPAVAPGTTFASALELSRAVASQPPVRPALEQAVVDQIVQNAVIALRNNAQEFRIQLKPDFLGVMEVRVSMDNGVVAVRMSVESAATRQLIDNNIGQLHQAFGADQVRVEHVPSFASSDAPWTFGQGAHQGFWNQAGYRGSNPLPEAIPYNAESEPAPAGVAQDAPPSGGIDIQA
jgi:flagellar hook-length control protein FliK